MKKSLLITVAVAACMLSTGVLSLAHAEERATGHPPAGWVGDAASERKSEAEGKVTPFYKGGLGGIKATVSLEEAIAIAKKEVPGEVVEAEYERGRTKSRF